MYLHGINKLLLLLSTSSKSNGYSMDVSWAVLDRALILCGNASAAKSLSSHFWWSSCQKNPKTYITSPGTLWANGISGGVFIQLWCFVLRQVNQGQWIFSQSEKPNFWYEVQKHIFVIQPSNELDTEFASVSYNNQVWGFKYHTGLDP